MFLDEMRMQANTEISLQRLHQPPERINQSTQTSPVESSICSSEESCSIRDNCFGRLVERPRFIKRLALGLSDALDLHRSEDITPLVNDYPIGSTPIRMGTSHSGYVNEAIADMDSKSSRYSSSQSVLQNKKKSSHFDRCLKMFKNQSCTKGEPEHIEFDGCSSTGSLAVSIAIFEATMQCLDDDDIDILKWSKWFQAGLSREAALEILHRRDIGDFIIRISTTNIGSFALSLRVPFEYQPSGVAHYLIIKTDKGFKIKGFAKVFPSIVSLVIHHSVMKELLPVPLSRTLVNACTEFNTTYTDSHDSTMWTVRDFVRKHKENNHT